MNDQVTQKIEEIIKCIGMDTFYEEKLVEAILEVERLGKQDRTKEIILLLNAFDLDEAIDKIETTYKDEIQEIYSSNSNITNKENEKK